MKIAIRADGGSKIGMGHIMRTLVLAKELTKTNDVFYICRYEEEFLGGINKIREEGFNVITIKGENLINDIIKVKADMLITDSYDVDEKYFSTVNKYFNKVGCIDDLNDKFYDVDFIINQNIGAEKLFYNTNTYSKLLLGTKYLMLREEFRENRPVEIKDKVQNVLITMGGADPLNATKKILNMVKDVGLNFHIVIGKNFKNIEYYKSLENENFKVYYNPNMIEIMKKCDIAIAACGSTIYELSALGIPTAAVEVADNQKLLAEVGNQEEIVINLGHINNLSKERLDDSIMYLMDKNNRLIINNNQIEKVSLNGVYNIIKEIL